METLHLTHTVTTDLTTIDDKAIEAFFAGLGIAASVVAHCEDAACPVCFASLQEAQAA